MLLPNQLACVTDSDCGAPYASPTPIPSVRSAGEIDRGRHDRRGSDLASQLQQEVDSFERSSFRMTYVIVALAGLALALTCLLAFGMIVLAGS